MVAELSKAEEWIAEQLQFDGAKEAQSRKHAPPLSVSWGQILTAAQYHGLAGLLLESRGTSLIPAAEREQLEEAAARERANTALHQIVLENWLSRFDAAGIPSIVLKGAALGALVYPRATLRWMTDVDLLVPRADFDHAGELLRAAGFSAERQLTDDSGTSMSTQVLWFQKYPIPAAIDLQWHPIDSAYYTRRMPIRWFWDHRMSLPFGARNMFVLTPEAQLLHLAAHLELHHAGHGLLWLYDVAALLHKFGGSLDWEVIIDTAEQCELAQSLKVTVRRAQALFAVAPPSSVCMRLESLRVSWHERLARVLAEPAAHPSAFLFDGWEQVGWRAKWRYWSRSLFPGAHFMQTHGPIQDRRALVLQYLMRLGRGTYRIPRALAHGMVRLLRAK